jgi:hypothetical protein
MRGKSSFVSICSLVCYYKFPAAETKMNPNPLSIETNRRHHPHFHIVNRETLNRILPLLLPGGPSVARLEGQGKGDMVKPWD